ILQRADPGEHEGRYPLVFNRVLNFGLRLRRYHRLRPETTEYRAARDEHEAGGVIGKQLLADEQDGEHAGEYRHQVDQDAAAYRAHALDAIAEQDRGNQGGHRADIEQPQQFARAQMHAPGLYPLERSERQRQQLADQRQGEHVSEQGQGLRPVFEAQGVYRPDHHRAQHQQVAGIELQVQQRPQVAVRQDQEHADERNRKPRRLQPARSTGVPSPADQNDQYRDGRIEQPQVDGGARGKSGINQGALRRAPQQRERQQQLPVAFE